MNAKGRLTQRRADLVGPALQNAGDVLTVLPAGLSLLALVIIFGATMLLAR